MVCHFGHFGHLGDSDFTLYLTVVQKNVTKMAPFYRGPPVITGAVRSHHVPPMSVFDRATSEVQKYNFFGPADVVCGHYLTFTCSQRGHPKGVLRIGTSAY